MKKASILLALLITGAVFSIWLFNSPQQPTYLTQTDPQIQLYTCSMHPHFRSEDPNEPCPICGMALIPVTNQQTQQTDAALNQVQLSQRSLALLQVQTIKAQRRDIHMPLQLIGTLNFNQGSHYTVAVPSAGRIEQVYLYETGTEVQQGQPLYEIYSPEIFIAQQEYLQARQQVQLNQTPLINQSNQTVLHAAFERLVYLGLTTQQIEQLEQRGVASSRIVITAPQAGILTTRSIQPGHYVNQGDLAFQITQQAPLWANLEVFEHDLTALAIGQQVRVYQANQQFIADAEIVSIAPQLNENSRTRQVRAQLNQPLAANQVSVGAFVIALVDIPLESRLLIPASAPLITGQRAVVYIQSAPDTFTLRQIELGRKIGEFYEVSAGLDEGEVLVSHGAFRIDSELQLQGGASMMSPLFNPDAPLHSPQEHSHTNQHTNHQTEGVQRPLDDLLHAYNALWQSLHQDDLTAWQRAAESFKTVLKQQTWPASLHTHQEQLAENYTHSLHITSLAEARNLFSATSNTMQELLPQGQYSTPVYLMYCPMAFHNQGATWLQTDNALLNPYFGADMLTCGENQAVFNPVKSQPAEVKTDHNTHNHGGH